MPFFVHPSFLIFNFQFSISLFLCPKQSIAPPVPPPAPPAPAPPAVPPAPVRRGQGRRADGWHRYVGECRPRRLHRDTGVDSRGCVAYPAACNPCSYECVECLWNEDGETVQLCLSVWCRPWAVPAGKEWFSGGGQDLEGVQPCFPVTWPFIFALTFYIKIHASHSE